MIQVIPAGANLVMLRVLTLPVLVLDYHRYPSVFQGGGASLCKVTLEEIRSS